MGMISSFGEVWESYRYMTNVSFGHGSVLNVISSSTPVQLVGTTLIFLFPLHFGLLNLQMSARTKHLLMRKLRSVGAHPCGCLRKRILVFLLESKGIYQYLFLLPVGPAVPVARKKKRTDAERNTPLLASDSCRNHLREEGNMSGDENILSLREDVRMSPVVSAGKCYWLLSAIYKLKTDHAFYVVDKAVPENSTGARLPNLILQTDIKKISAFHVGREKGLFFLS